MDNASHIDLLLEQHGTAYQTFSLSDRERHQQLLATILRREDVALSSERISSGTWRITVVAADAVGLLSILTGVFAAHDVDIMSGALFTLKCKTKTTTRARSGSKRRRPRQNPKHVTAKILDVFEVRVADTVEESYWKEIEQELRTLARVVAEGRPEEAREEIIDRVSHAVLADGDERLPPVQIFLDNNESPTLTKLRIEAADTPGFIFEFSNALAMLNINIVRVDIRTVGRDVQDTFWITDSHDRKIQDPSRLQQIRLAATLIKQFTHMLPRAPNPTQALRQFSALTLQMLGDPESWPDIQTLSSSVMMRTMADLMGMSQFLWEDFLRMQHENLFPVIQDLSGLEIRKTQDALETELSTEMELADNYDDRVEVLNKFKDREMFRIDLRHITHRIGFEEFSDELSDLAELLVDWAAHLCFEQLKHRFGTPRDEAGNECDHCACALGKFGGRELGYASDIELIFVYRSNGTTDGTESVQTALFYEELVSMFLKTLSARQEGIFHIDLRLRPYGKGGALASSLEGFANYFSLDGPAEQFERMAMVKLRPVAGSDALCDEIVAARNEFVYSGVQIDYGNVLYLRTRQVKELVPHGETSAKLSRGGLVDIEYFVQLMQIESGNQHSEVRATNTMEAVRQLQTLGIFDTGMARQILGAYSFLRRLIDALRAVRGNAKDLTIPPPESREFSYLSRRLNLDSPATLAAQITIQMRYALDLWSEINNAESEKTK